VLIVQGLQQAVFPRRAQFEDGVYRTGETSMFFFKLEAKLRKKGKKDW
jgi:hypothetical protein